jgi:hypothetical protein
MGHDSEEHGSPAALARLRQAIRMNSGGPHPFKHDFRQSSRPKGPAKLASVTRSKSRSDEIGSDRDRKMLSLIWLRDQVMFLFLAKLPWGCCFLTAAD